MGTHISRVKSVDLDAWTDEQIQGVLKWGNARANKCVLVLIVGMNRIGIGADGVQILGGETRARSYTL